MGNYKTETLKWFQHLPPHERIEYMCNILQLCLPTELRYFGSYLENLASKDFSTFKEFEALSNNSSELEKALTSSGTIAKAALYLSLLNSKNLFCADIIYNFLINNWVVIASIESNESALLTYTMAAYHPAFTFYQHQHLKKVQQWFECRARSKTYEKIEDAEPSITENIEDISVEPSEDISNNSELHSFYDIKVTRSFKSLSTVRRCRSDFEEFHKKITQQFTKDLANGLAPKMNFDWNSGELSDSLTLYLRHFLKLSPAILYSSTMQEFLCPTHTATANDIGRTSEHRTNYSVPNESSVPNPTVIDMDKDFYITQPTYLLPSYPHYYRDNSFWLPHKNSHHYLHNPSSFLPPTTACSASSPEDSTPTLLPTSFSTPHLRQSIIDTEQVRTISQMSNTSSSDQPIIAMEPPSSPPDSGSTSIEARLQTKYPTTTTTNVDYPENVPLTQIVPELIESGSVSSKQRAVVHVQHSKPPHDIASVVRCSSNSLLEMSSEECSPVSSRHNSTSVALGSSSGDSPSNQATNSVYAGETVLTEAHPYHHPQPLPSPGVMPFVRNPGLKHSRSSCSCVHCRSPAGIVPLLPHHCYLPPPFSQFNQSHIPLFQYGYIAPFRPPPVVPPGNSTAVVPPVTLNHHHLRPTTCYNCGQVGHTGLSCKSKSIDSRFSGEGSFHLNFAPVITPNHPLNSD